MLPIGEVLRRVAIGISDGRRILGVGAENVERHAACGVRLVPVLLESRRGRGVGGTGQGRAADRLAVGDAGGGEPLVDRIERVHEEAVHADAAVVHELLGLAILIIGVPLPAAQYVDIALQTGHDAPRVEIGRNLTAPARHVAIMLGDEQRHRRHAGRLRCGGDGTRDLRRRGDEIGQKPGRAGGAIQIGDAIQPEIVGAQRRARGWAQRKASDARIAAAIRALDKSLEAGRELELGVRVERETLDVRAQLHFRPGRAIERTVAALPFAEADRLEVGAGIIFLYRLAVRREHQIAQARCIDARR